MFAVFWRRCAVLQTYWNVLCMHIGLLLTRNTKELHVYITNHSHHYFSASGQHTDFMTPILKLLDNKMARSYGTRYAHLIVDHPSVQKYCCFYFCNILSVRWQHCLDSDVAIKELSLQYACKIAQGHLQKKTEKRLFLRWSFIQNTNKSIHLNVPSASIIQQGGHEDSNARVDVKADRIWLKSKEPWMATCIILWVWKVKRTAKG